MEILSPLEQSILQWDNSCGDKTVDNFDPSMTMNGGCHENGDFINDQTFHTPSFGDEEFDIPPINLQPTSGSDANSSDVYGCTQPLSHHQLQSQPQTPQQHMLPPSPPLSQHSPQPPPPCSQAIGQSDRGLVMTAVTSSPTMSNYVDVSQQNRYQGPPTSMIPMEPQQDMYMVQLGEGGMLPPQSVHFQVQTYNMPSNYNNSTNGSHLDHPPRMTHPHHQYRMPPHPTMGVPQLHNLQHNHQSMMGQSSMFSLQLGPPRQPRPGSVGSSPPGSNHTSPGLETSEDSDDSGHLTLLMGSIKRPSPEPMERPPSGGKPLKRPKTQKKKKKRDPNEPQKPVSAYALFFRDTQAAIKGQNPNASFGEVSKIVASMWDGLDIDHKNVYKRKTEAAKKEYLKALAAYRASLVSKAANDQSDNIYGGGTPGPSTPVTSSSPLSTPGGPSPLQKKSPLLTSLMEGTSPITSLHNMTQPQPLLLGQGIVSGMAQQHMLPQNMQHNNVPQPNQMLHQMLSPGGQMIHMMAQHPMGNHPGQQPQRNGQINSNNNMAYNTNMMGSPNQLGHPAGQRSQGAMMCSPPPQLQNCLRNPGDQQQQQQQQQQQPPPDWEREFCNNDCVVSHCRDVYTTWVASRPPPPNSYASVK